MESRLLLAGAVGADTGGAAVGEASGAAPASGAPGGVIQVRLIPSEGGVAVGATAVVLAAAVGA